MTVFEFLKTANKEDIINFLYRYFYCTGNQDGFDGRGDSESGYFGVGEYMNKDIEDFKKSIQENYKWVV